MTNQKQKHNPSPKVKSTPGPWELGALVNNDEGVLHRQVIARSQSSVSGATITPTICTVSGYSSRRDDNARLIAAAPELLRACEQTFQRLSLVYSYFKEAANKNIGVLGADFYASEAKITQASLENLSSIISKARGAE